MTEEFLGILPFFLEITVKIGAQPPYEHSLLWNFLMSFKLLKASETFQLHRVFNIRYGVEIAFSAQLSIKRYQWIKSTSFIDYLLS